jgi:hypothetical protein
MTKIQDVLKQLNPGNDDHWTAEGMPRVDVVSALAGTQVTRQEVTTSAPQFTRSNPIIGPEINEMQQSIVQQPQQSLTSPVGAAVEDKSFDENSEDSARANARAKIQDLEEHLVRLDRAQQELTTERNKTILELDKTREYLVKIDPKEHPSTVIQNYLDSQKRAAHSRAENIQKILATGLTPGMFRQQSPLDAALRNAKRK